MWLNLSRVLLRRAVATAYGTGLTFQRGPVDRSFFDALALVEEEADELMFQTNVERAKQVARAEWKGLDR